MKYNWPIGPTKYPSFQLVGLSKPSPSTESPITWTSWEEQIPFFESNDPTKSILTLQTGIEKSRQIPSLFFRKVSDVLPPRKTWDESSCSS